MKSRRARGTREETRKRGLGKRKESSFPRPLAAPTIARAFSCGSSSLAQIEKLTRRLKNMRLKGSKIKASTLSRGFVKIFGSKVQTFPRLFQSNNFFFRTQINRC